MPRAKTINELDAAAEAPGIMPPPGVQAKVKTQVEYLTDVDTGHRRELEDLAASEAPNLPPLDPLSDFLETWSQYAQAGYNCVVIRLPDPSSRRAPGATYRRPHFGNNPESLGATQFSADYSTFVSTLQTLNGNSGGYFQVWLIDQYGTRVPEATLWSVAVGDPVVAPGLPQQQQQPAYYPQPQAPAPSPVKSEMEKEMESLQREMFRTTIMRALNPPPPPAPVGNGLNPEDQAKLFMLGQAPTLFPAMFSQIFEAQRAALDSINPAAKDPTWKDRAIDAGLELAKSNPAIVQHLSGVAERLVAMITGLLLPNASAAAAAQLPPQAPIDVTPIAPPPPPPPATQTQPASAPDDDDDGDPEPTEAEITMDILEEFVSLLSSDRPIKEDDPIFLELHQSYPEQFARAVNSIATFPESMIVTWVRHNGSQLHRNLLDSSVTGPHLRKRIGELKACFVAAKESVAKAARAQAEAQTPPPPAPPEDSNGK